MSAGSGHTRWGVAPRAVMADISEGVSAKDGGVSFASSRPRLVDLGTGVIPRCRCHCSTTALGVTSSP